MNNKHFFITLAKNNIQKNGRFYLPYILAFIGTVAMYYNISALAYNEGIKQLPGADSMLMVMEVGVGVVGIFSVLFLFYTNSFVIRQRKKEFGLYNILGMEKRHVAKVLFLESGMICLLGIVGGLLIGILFNKLVSLILINIMKIQTPIKFAITTKPVVSTMVLFAIISLITFLANEISLAKTKPIELLQGNKLGEREPKTKWFMTLVGIVSIGVAYYISITIKSPLDAFTLFFFAVLFVILGTYCLFTAGSIVLLKLLRKNKKYYYQTKHFTAVSGMLYRMKQNAAGLSSICILSTMVLVMISTTVCLYMGVENALETRFPCELSAIASFDDQAAYDEEQVKDIMEHAVKESGAKVEKISTLRYLSFAGMDTGEEYSFDHSNLLGSTKFDLFVLITAEAYQQITGEHITLKEDEVYAWDSDTQTKKEFKLFDEQFHVAKYVENFDAVSEDGGYMVNMHYLVVASDEVVNRIYQAQKKHYGEQASSLSAEVNVEIDGTDEQKKKSAQLTGEALARMETECEIYAESRTGNREEFYMIYGGLLFLGLFLGVVFLMATVLIIYYKQISEGYDDRERFQIMQKVGMSKREVKASIRSQVLTVFFLPLITATIHVAAAFPIIEKLLNLLNLSNTSLFIWCLIVTVCVFAIVYAIVYSLTSKAYYRIVQ